MGKKITAIVGAAVALAAGPAVSAAIAPDAPAVPVAASYAELLRPIPDAVERLKRADAEAANRPASEVPVQYQVHHHHHHHRSRAWYRAHGYVWSGGAWVLAPVSHHHHHHHHDR